MKMLKALPALLGHLIRSLNHPSSITACAIFAAKLNQSQETSLPDRYPFTPEWRQVILVKFLAQVPCVTTGTQTHTLLNRNTRA